MKPTLLLSLTIPLLATTSCEKIKKIAKIDNSDTEETTEATALTHTTRLTEASYQPFIEKTDTLVVVAFSADWCPPCRQLAPILDKVAGEFRDSAHVGRLNTDHAPNIANLAGVSSIPDVRLFRNGQVVHRFTGTKSESELRQLFNLHTQNPSAENSGDSTPPSIRPMDKDHLPPGIRRP